MPARASNALSPARQLDAFIAERPPEMAKLASSVLAKMRERIPGAVEMVYRIPDPGSRVPSAILRQ